MKEYCSEVICDEKVKKTLQAFGFKGGTKEFTHAFIKRLCGLLRCSVQNNFTTTTIETKSLREERNWLIQSGNVPVDVSVNVQPLSSPQVQLQTVIRQLEMQNRWLSPHFCQKNLLLPPDFCSELQQMLLLSNKSDKEMKRYLEEHRVHVAAQIHKLKILKVGPLNTEKNSFHPFLQDYLQVSKPALVQQNSAPANLQSTPMVLNGKQTRLGLDMFSPITPISEQAQVLSESENEQASSGIDGSSSVYSLRDVSSWVGGTCQRQDFS